MGAWILAVNHLAVPDVLLPGGADDGWAPVGAGGPDLPCTAQPNNSVWKDGYLAVTASVNDLCGALNSCNITLKDNLGSSVTVTLPPAKY
jgi:hypothetical protein